MADRPDVVDPPQQGEEPEEDEEIPAEEGAMYDDEEAGDEYGDEEEIEAEPEVGDEEIPEEEPEVDVDDEEEVEEEGLELEDVIRELEAEPEIESIGSIRMTADPDLRLVEVKLVVEAWKSGCTGERWHFLRLR